MTWILIISLQDAFPLSRKYNSGEFRFVTHIRGDIGGWYTSMYLNAQYWQILIPRLWKERNLWSKEKKRGVKEWQENEVSKKEKNMYEKN